MPPTENPEGGEVPVTELTSSEKRSLWPLILMGFIFIAIGAGGAYLLLFASTAKNLEEIVSLDNNPSTLEEEQWSVSTIPAQLPGAPRFTISHPASFGMAHVSVDIRNPSQVNHYGNLGKIVFYKPSWEEGEIDFFLRGSFTVKQLEEGETLSDFVSTQLLPEAIDRVGYKIDGRPVIALKTLPDAAMTAFFIEYSEGLVLELHLLQNQHEVDIAESLLLQEKMVKSIQFFD